MALVPIGEEVVGKRQVLRLAHVHDPLRNRQACFVPLPDDRLLFAREPGALELADERHARPSCEPLECSPPLWSSAGGTHERVVHLVELVAAPVLRRLERRELRDRECELPVAPDCVVDLGCARQHLLEEAAPAVAGSVLADQAFPMVLVLLVRRRLHAALHHDEAEREEDLLLGRDPVASTVAHHVLHDRAPVRVEDEREQLGPGRAESHADRAGARRVRMPGARSRVIERPLRDPVWVRGIGDPRDRSYELVQTARVVAGRERVVPPAPRRFRADCHCEQRRRLPRLEAAMPAGGRRRVGGWLPGSPEKCAIYTPSSPEKCVDPGLSSPEKCANPAILGSMERRAAKSLEAWKEDQARKPLVLRGARQVGKTWLLREFGRTHYEQVAYVNCQRDQSVASIFDGDLDPNRILRGLEIAARTTIEPATTLLIIDEIQDVPAALTALKYFDEERPDIHIATAGSLLGVALRAQGASFPVGKVNFLDLHPLDFDEFLRGTGETQLADLVVDQDWDLIHSLRDRFIELLRLYLFIGGMPEAVARHVSGAPVDAVRAVQLDILRGYENDFAKYASAAESRRIAQVWASMPTQLARENKRFVLGRVREGARARDFEDAIQWLSDAGLVHRVTRYTKPGNPVRTYEDAHIFKLFLHDVGLLGALSALDPSVLLQGTGIFEEFKGALTEQYVLQQIVAARDEVPMYWSPEKPTAELDFAIERAEGLVPIEVKAEENLRSKSLRSYIDRFNPAGALRFSLANYREQENMINVPLYAIGPWVR